MAAFVTLDGVGSAVFMAAGAAPDNAVALGCCTVFRLFLLGRESLLNVSCAGVEASVCLSALPGEDSNPIAECIVPYMQKQTKQKK